jgi:cysteine desulfurase
VRTPVYLDCHATTPLDPRVLEAMMPYLVSRFGNAASRTHRFGWEAEKAVDRARGQVAQLAGADPSEVIFTSGATESNNLAIRGTMEAAAPAHRRMVTVATEHRSVLDPVSRLTSSGFEATILAPEPDGIVSLDAIEQAIGPDTALVSVMCANNEIGVLQPVREIAAICARKAVVFHSDTVQSFGIAPTAMKAEGIGLLSVSAHKIYGPKGVGALLVRPSRVRLRAQMDGGGHEAGLRPGTLNVPGIVGFGEACAICASEMKEEAGRVAALRDRLLETLRTGLDGVTVNGSLEHRLPGNLNVAFGGVNASALLLRLPELALSTGSACSSAHPEPSHVLKAIGLGTACIRSSVRFGLGRFTTAEEVDYAATRLVEAVRELRSLSPQ